MSKRLMTILLAAFAGIGLPARAELKVHIIDIGQAASAIVELDQLSGKKLEEVHVCYDLDFKFRECDTSSAVHHTSAVTIRPTAP